MDVRYVCFITESTGKIERIVFPQNEFPNEGVTDGVRVVYLTDTNMGTTDLAEFMDKYWFNTTTLQFVDVGAPPNNYATYSMSTSSWSWDAAPVLADIRSYRAQLLFSTDWTQVSDNTLTDAQREEARTYRTALRNITSSLSNPENVDAVTWPTPPSFL